MLLRYENVPTAYRYRYPCPDFPQLVSSCQKLNTLREVRFVSCKNGKNGLSNDNR